MSVHDELTAALHDRFAIERLAGEGGMAYVYEAIDLKHGRRVAIKALKPEISTDLGSERFLREIRIVARLTHPNVMPLHESGQVKGVLYYVMPFVTGENLRDRLHREPRLALEESVEIFREVCHALSYAHSQGVVHRDLKPANIMLSGGIAVVTDFGIARALDFSAAEQLTSLGLAIGTPTYMSPEQASGESMVDARSDIYSLGCILHELLTGAPPYRGPSAIALIAQHAAEPIPDIQQSHPTVPAALARATRKALAKSPPERFASVDDFVRAIDAATPSSVNALGGRRRSGRYMIAGAAIIIVALGAWVLFRPSAANAAPLLAVLALEHQGPPEEKYLSDGITDEISNRIAEVSGIGVVSRTSAMQFELPRNSLREIADKLKVDYVLAGSIRTDRRADGTRLVRVVPKLVHVASGREIALDEFDAALVPGEIFEIQSGIARSVATALDIALSPEALQALAVRPTTNLQAYGFYLRGIVHATQFLVRGEQAKAIEMFDNAVRLDPQFALVYARLAQVHALYYSIYDRSPERLRIWEVALNRATELGPELTQTRIARGQWYFYARQDTKRAMVEIEALREKRPNDTELLWLLGRVQRTNGNFAGALASFDGVAALDPRSAIFPFEAATALYMMRRYDEALARVERAVTLAPDWLPPQTGRAQVLLAAGRIDDARSELVKIEKSAETLVPQLINDPLYRPLWDIVLPETYHEALARMTLGGASIDSAEYYRAKGRLHARRGNEALMRAYFDSTLAILESRRGKTASPFLYVDLGTAYASVGRPAEARAHADSAARADFLSRDAFRGWFATLELARLYALLGATNEAITTMERLDAGAAALPVGVLRIDPAFATLRSDPRFQALLEKE